MAFGPEVRMMARAARPRAVACAAIVSVVEVVIQAVFFRELLRESCCVLLSNVRPLSRLRSFAKTVERPGFPFPAADFWLDRVRR
jgi:hypothetical protein